MRDACFVIKRPAMMCMANGEEKKRKKKEKKKVVRQTGIGGLGALISK